MLSTGSPEQEVLPSLRRGTQPCGNEGPLQVGSSSLVADNLGVSTWSFDIVWMLQVLLRAMEVFGYAASLESTGMLL